MPASDYIVFLREKIGHDTIMIPSSSAVIFNEAGEVLLHQRSDNGNWSLVGGAADPGEHPAETLVRETLEEAGVRVKPERLVGIYTAEARYPNGDHVVYTSAAFQCCIIDGEPHVADDESLAVRFFAPDNLPDSLRANHKMRIHHALTRTDSYFDMPDKMPESTNQSYMKKIRAHIGSERMMLPGTDAVIRDDKGRILVQKRTDFDMWNLPGGIIEVDETPAATIMREVYEETGLTVQPTRLIGVYGGKDYFVTYPNGDKVAYTNYAFEARITGGTLQADEKESAALKFVAADNLPEPFYDNHHKIIDHALNRNDTYFKM